MYINKKIIFCLLIIALGISGCSQPTQNKESSMLPPGESSESKLAEGPNVRVVKIETEDGLKLNGRFFGRGDVGVVLGHMYPADQNSWSKTARKLSGLGYTVLTFDFRGYGLSEGTKNISQIDKDMRAAIGAMSKKTKKIFLIGASMGGTAALKVGPKENVAGIATLSAPKEFMGLTVGNINEIMVPTLFLASAADGDAPENARDFYDQAREPREIEILPGSNHGTQMLLGDDNLALPIIEGWLNRQVKSLD